MSRMYYVCGTLDNNTTIETVARLEENQRKYGVDTDDESEYEFKYEGRVSVHILLYEQAESVLRSLWNHRVRVCEIGEQSLDESTGEIVDRICYLKQKNECPGLSTHLDILKDMNDNPMWYLDGLTEDEEEEGEEEDDDD